ncbi:MAG: hypothetical protein RSB67_01460 [Clostridia bacterium]
MSKKNRLKGSGVLLVILTSVTFSIYAMSTFSEQEHFDILTNKYEKNIVEKYSKSVEDINGFYEKTIIKINENR